MPDIRCSKIEEASEAGDLQRCFVSLVDLLKSNYIFAVAYQILKGTQVNQQRKKIYSKVSKKKQKKFKMFTRLWKLSDSFWSEFWIWHLSIGMAHRTGSTIERLRF